MLNIICFLKMTLTQRGTPSGSILKLPTKLVFVSLPKLSLLLEQKIIFNILNFIKPTSLFQTGMKVSVFSKQQQHLSNRSWFKGGEDIAYFQNAIPRHSQGPSNTNNSFLLKSNPSGEGTDFFYTMSFTYEFGPEDDEVWFA